MATCAACTSLYGFDGAAQLLVGKFGQQHHMWVHRTLGQDKAQLLHGGGGAAAAAVARAIIHTYATHGVSVMSGGGIMDIVRWGRQLLASLHTLWTLLQTQGAARLLQHTARAIMVSWRARGGDAWRYLPVPIAALLQVASGTLPLAKLQAYVAQWVVGLRALAAKPKQLAFSLMMALLTSVARFAESMRLWWTSAAASALKFAMALARFVAWLLVQALQGTAVALKAMGSFIKYVAMSLKHTAEHMMRAA